MHSLTLELDGGTWSAPSLGHFTSQGKSPQSRSGRGGCSENFQCVICNKCIGYWGSIRCSAKHRDFTFTFIKGTIARTDKKTKDRRTSYDSGMHNNSMCRGTQIEKHGAAAYVFNLVDRVGRSVNKHGSFLRIRLQSHAH